MRARLDVEAHGVEVLAELHRQRQADIAQTRPRRSGSLSVLNSMIFPFFYKTLRGRGGDLAVPGRARRGLTGECSVISVRSVAIQAAVTPTATGPAPPLALWIRSSIASCGAAHRRSAAGTRSGYARAHAARRRHRRAARWRARRRPCPARARSARRSSRGRRRPGCRRRAARRAARAACCRRVALAQRIEAVALAGMQAARQRQRVEHAAQAGDACALHPGRRASSASRNATSKGALWMISSAPSMKASSSSAISANFGCLRRSCERRCRAPRSAPASISRSGFR